MKRKIGIVALLALLLALLSAGQFAQPVLRGSVVIGAVVLDRFTQGRQKTA